VEFQHADNLSLILFSIFAVVMAFFCFKAIMLATQWKKWSVIYLGIILLFSIAASSGLMVKSFIPMGPILFTLVFIFSIAFSLSAAGAEVSKILPITILIGFQGFRFPLELILHHWASIETIPNTMTWTGQNWDIATGILSLCSIPFIHRSKQVALVVNSIGFLLLLNVIRVVVLSSPLPFAWELANPLRLVVYFPYCLIGPLFVLPAFAGHLLAYRKILAQNEGTPKPMERR
jgi:hypothetical protein